MCENNGLRRVRLIVARGIELPEDALAPNARLVEDLGADRLDLLQIVANLEREFTIRIEDHEVSALGTVADVMALIERRTGGRANACSVQQAPVARPTPRPST